MPSRWLSLAIVTFWLGMTSWLVWRDLVPRWRPGQPPPYTIDLVEEVQSKYRPRNQWDVYHNGQHAFDAETWVEHPQSDVFELKGRLKPPVIGHVGGVAMGPLHVQRMDSTYRVTQDGRLLGIEGEVTGKFQLGLSAGFTASVRGAVHRDVFESTLRLAIPLLGKENEVSLPAVAMPARASVLLPLHPVHRIQGLRHGQEWDMALFNPLEAALGAIQQVGDGTHRLQARVLPETQSFTWKRRKDIPCLVIEYRGEDLTGQTWVEETTGLVLRQEARRADEHWVMHRD